MRSVEFSDGETLCLRKLTMDHGEETGEDNGNRKATFEAITNIQQKKL